MNTDQRGRFAFERDATSGSHSVIVEASTRTNHYGVATLDDFQGNVVVATKTLPEVVNDHWRMRYDRFGDAATVMGITTVELVEE